MLGGCLGGAWGCLGVILVHPGVILGPPGVNPAFWSSWSHSGVILGHPGVVSEHFKDKFQLCHTLTNSQIDLHVELLFSQLKMINTKTLEDNAS